MRGFGGNIAAHLRQQRDQRVLPQEGRFTGHVGTGQQPDRGAIPGREIAIVGDEGIAALLPQRLFHHRMASALHVKRAGGVHLWPGPVFAARQIGQCGDQIQLCQPLGSGVEPRSGVQNSGRKPVIEPFFDLQRPVSCVQDPGFDLAQLYSGETHLICGSLTVDVSFGQRR